MILKEYQIDATRDLLEDSKKLLGKSDQSVIVFRSPTGSGKTVMMARFLQMIVKDADIKVPIAFIWAAPRKLHEQSKNSIEEYFEDNRILECSYFEELQDRQIQKNEILFLNWHSINQKDNIFIRENETENYLDIVIQRTKEANRKIILIIDESHSHATTDNAKYIIDKIQPSLTVEVSATPIIRDPDKIVSIPLEDVKEEEMIKKSVSFNPGFGNILKNHSLESDISSSTESFVLDEALKKRESLVKAYKAEGKDINPLLLVQLPDKRNLIDDQIKESVVSRLNDKYKINVQNGKLGIHLSGQSNKENLKNIQKLNSSVEVLLFKQAIALGWDCPRAAILVLFRDWKNFEFSIQTLGRIMRVAEPDVGYYQNDILNYGYVYTNLSSIKINPDVENYMRIHTSYRKEAYLPLQFNSFNRTRHRETTRLSPLFTELFLQQAKLYGLSDKINLSNQVVEESLISDVEISDIDQAASYGVESSVSTSIDNNDDLQRIFDFFVRNNLTPFYPEDRSIGRVKKSIYRFFEVELKMHYAELNQWRNILNIVLSEDNRNHFLEVLRLTKDAYKEEVAKRESDYNNNKQWEIPEEMNFPGSFVKDEDAGTSIMQPFYYNAQWKTETSFIEKLKNSKNIEWWFKNGDEGLSFFAVPYQDENDENRSFYIDFIVKFKDGRIGLFDTKSGNTIIDSRYKSDGLQEYIQRHQVDKNFIGGIITSDADINNANIWHIYKGKGGDIQNKHFGNWELLDSI